MKASSFIYVSQTTVTNNKNTANFQMGTLNFHTKVDIIAVSAFVDDIVI